MVFRLRMSVQAGLVLAAWLAVDAGPAGIGAGRGTARAVDSPAQGGGVPGAQGGRGGRGGLPGATPEQTQALADMNAALADQIAAVAAARSELAATTLANPAALPAAVERVRVAELALALKRSEEFAKLQAGPNKLNADQVAALIAAGGTIGGGRGPRGGGPAVDSPAGRVR